MKKLQIGVMGSASDLNYSEEIEKIAVSVGEELARRNCITFFGAEKDYDSLSTIAARAAKNAGGTTVGVTYGKGKDVFGGSSSADIFISTGIERGGGREFVLVLSCDAIIAIGGGSGTLTEMAIAYQANIPIVVLKNTGGWSEKLAGQYIDERKRILIKTAENPAEAVDLVISTLQKSEKLR